MKSLLVAVYVLCSGLSAWSQNDYIVQKNDPEIESIEEGSSAFNRINTKSEIGVQLIGMGPSFLPTFDLYYGYKLDRKSLLLLEATYGFDNYRDNANRGYSAGVHYKKFAGNSFYWRGGLDYRQFKYYHFNGGSNFYQKSEFVGNSLAINFQIGNQWQWENFTVGCDWIGVSVPLTHSISDESVSANDNENYNHEQRLMKDQQGDFVKNTNINLLGFYIGWAF